MKREYFTDNVYIRPRLFDQSLCIGSKLAICASLSTKQLFRQSGTQAKLHSRCSSARQSFCMTTNRNRLTPSGKRAPIPVNTEVVREHLVRNREWPKQMNALIVGEHLSKPLRFQGRRNGQLSVDVWGSNRMLLGDRKSESNQKRSSVSKETGEARLSMVIARIGCQMTVESLPMRQSGVGAPIVVRKRENRLHGEGVQDISFWITERFNN